MKTSKVPERLAASDEEVARLLASLADDAPARGADAAIMALIDAADLDEERRFSPALSRWPVWRSLAIAGGLLVTLVLAVRVTTRESATVYEAVHAQHSQESNAAPAGVALSPQLNNREESGEPVPTPSIAVTDLPAARSHRTSVTASVSAGRAENKDSFREQLAIVESARHSLSQGETAECLATLRRYDAKYPTGLFTTEVRVVQIEALMASGQPERAHALARGLLATDPHGPYADRLRSLLPQTDGTDR